MTKVVLPRLNQTGANEWADVEANDVALREVVNGGIDNENIKAAAGITRGQLEAAAKPVTWYASSIIAGEQESTSSTYALLPTPDEIPGVVVPTGGKMIINFGARLLCTVAEAGKAGIFIGANQLVSPGGSVGNAVEVHTTTKETWSKITTAPSNLSGMAIFGGGTTGTDVATGQMISQGALEVYVPAGTYNVSVKVHSEFGAPVKMRERKLYVEVHGF